MLPSSAEFVIVGAGIHGLSTAWHLAEMRGRGDDIIVVDKAVPGAGASGIACGVVRNNYFQSSMRELMAHSVDIWESDPEAFHYHSVGYLQISPDSMRADVEKIHGEQRAIGYDSTLITGAKEIRRLYERHFSRLASTRRHFCAARKTRRLRAQSSLRARARRQGEGMRRARLFRRKSYRRANRRGG